MSIRGAIDRRLKPYNRVAVWGAGGLARTAMARWLPPGKVRDVIDGTGAADGKRLADLAVKGPDSILNDGIDCVVICTSAESEVRAQLASIGFTGDIFFVYELFFDPSDTLTEMEKLRIDIEATRNAAWPIFLLRKPQVLVNISYRLVRYFDGSPLLFPLFAVCYVLHYLFCMVLSIQLPHETEIGPGFVIAHPGTIVFTGRARIGAFFTMYHCTTIGTTTSGGTPQIGDFVTIYAGAHVLGGTVLGNHSRVAANAVVLDLTAPDWSTVAGLPATVRRSRNSSHGGSGDGHVPA